MTEPIVHGTYRCIQCEERRAAEAAANEKADLVGNLSDAALVALTDSIQTIYRETRPPA